MCEFGCDSRICIQPGRSILMVCALCLGGLQFLQDTGGMEEAAGQLLWIQQESHRPSLASVHNDIAESHVRFIGDPVV